MQPRARSARKRLTRRSSSEWNEITASRPPGRSSSHASGSAASSCASSSLTAIRIAWNVRLAGWPPAKRAGAGIAAVIASTSSNVVASVTCAAADDLGGDARRRSAPRRTRAGAREAAGASHVLTISRRSSSLVGVHAHVQRRVVGVGEAALARVDLHRGHAEVEVDQVGAQALGGQLRRGRRRSPRAGSACGTASRPPARRRRPRRAGRGRSPMSRPAGPESARRRGARGPRRRAWRRSPTSPTLRIERLDQLAGEDRDVRAGHVKQDGQGPR